jgi:hypothetical protein
MEELDALREQLKQLQEEHVSVAAGSLLLNERNAVDLVMKLMNGGLVQLVFTEDGREYVTPTRLREDLLRMMERGGRVPLAALAPQLRVSAAVVEDVVADLAKKRALFAVGLEVLSREFLDTVASEIGEALQASTKGSIGTEELATRFALPEDFLLSEAIQPHLGKGGPLRGIHAGEGVLYGDAFVEWHRCRVRGLLMAATYPTPLAPLVSAHGFNSAIFSLVVSELTKSGKLAGALEEGRTTFVPAVY